MSVFVVSEISVDIYRGYYSEMCLCVCCKGQRYERSPWVLQWGVSVCVVNERELWTFSVGVTVGSVCLCLL